MLSANRWISRVDRYLLEDLVGFGGSDFLGCMLMGKCWN